MGGYITLLHRRNSLSLARPFQTKREIDALQTMLKMSSKHAKSLTCACIHPKQITLKYTLVKLMGGITTLKFMD